MACFRLPSQHWLFLFKTGGQKMAKKSTVIVFDRELLESRAYYALNRNAIIVFNSFMGKRQIEKVGKRGKERHVIRNNGEIIFSYSYAKKTLELSPVQFTRAVDDLIEKGFIDIAEKGGALGSTPTKYEISARWKNYGEDNFERVTRERRLACYGFCRPSQ